ncbi:zinc finger protein 184-like isoform X2 [Sitophilus oryzae]|uniref:Zinc finger protein 184-like isoform X2 n=1 Tax=Sitophilus oryzae TaxID=7048 RepID=A0A6J2YRG2_SITOR|nr:zinc finger protein 184-like isoform X2 [Sitophilus oryzae]
MERCRICLTSRNLSNIFETEEIAQHITVIACVDVLPDDGLPPYICLLCKHELDISINFKDKCETTFDLLQKEYNEEKQVQVNENIILNLLSGDNNVDRTLPDNVNEYVIESVNSHLLENGQNVENLQSNFEDGNSTNEVTTFENYNQVEIVENPESMDQNQIIDSTENETEISGNLRACRKCNVHFSNDEDFFKHLEILHSQPIKQCELCFMYFPNSNLHKVHLSKMHNVENNSKTVILKCKVCSQASTSQSELNVHLCNHSGQDSISISENSLEGHNMDHDHDYSSKHFRCTVCDKTFSVRIFKEHMKYHKNGFSSLKDYSMKGAQDLNELKHNSLYTCPECNKSFTNTSNLGFHRKSHIKIKPHICSICQMSFFKSSGLEKHLFEQHEDLIVCTTDESIDIFQEDGDMETIKVPPESPAENLNSS